MPNEKDKPDLKKLLETDNLDQLKRESAQPKSKDKAELKRVIDEIKGASTETKEPKTAAAKPKKPHSSFFSRFRRKKSPKSKRPKFIKEELKKAETREKLPSPDELEAEWKAKIKEAKRKEESVIPEAKAKQDKTETLESAFQKLKTKQGKAPVAAAKEKERLQKIGGVVKGAVPEIRERELTGVKIPFVYKLFSIGQLPPLNLLSKAYNSAKGRSLEASLDSTRIPLYPVEYAAFATAIGFILSLVILLAVLLFTRFDIILSLLAMVVSLFAISFMVLTIPSSKSRGSARDINKQLPFALRHMSALLTAGISIFDALTSISKSDYGALSYELDEVVWDVKSGESLSDALEASARRVNSKQYNRVVVHIRRALQMGGNVAEIITQIADDMTFEMRMKISDFVEKLNAFAIVYLVGGIVGPVVVAIFSVIQNIPIFGGQSAAGSYMPAFLLLFIFPMMMALIVYIVKVMEPRV